MDPASERASSVHHKHSLANVSDAWRNATTGRRGSSVLTSFRGSAAAGLNVTARNARLDSIQTAVVQLFQKKKLQEFELPNLQENVRHLISTEAGPLIYDYYKDKLLKKGMVILRESLKNDKGEELLSKLVIQWNYFYTEILPTLQAMLYNVPTKDLSIRQVTLLEFRDTVLLKLDIEDALDAWQSGDNPALVQICLVLQSIPDGNPPSENYLKMEQLTAKLVIPYLGLKGLYSGSVEPDIKAVIQPVAKPSITVENEDSELDTDSSSHSHKITPLFGSPKQRRRPGNGLLASHLLAPLVEQETGRRHSIQT